MTKYRIKYLEQAPNFRDKPMFRTTTVEAHSFKVNDQGTVLFTGKSGNVVAAFKHWVTIKPVKEAPKGIRMNEVAVALPESEAIVGPGLARGGRILPGRDGHPFSVPPGI